MTVAGTRIWLLDLDNTLHDAGRVVFPRINAAMTDFVESRLALSRVEADALREHYWHRYGATMLGLIRHHGVDAREFLRETHPFPDLSSIVRRDHRLAHALRRLPGRRIVVTNAPSEYAHAVIRALGVSRLIERVVSIESMQFAGRFQPKPSRPMLRRLIAGLRAHALNCVLVEDTAANLHSARAIGLRTVLVTGLSSARERAGRKSRAGSGRRVDVQVQSVALLPRRALRSPHRTP